VGEREGNSVRRRGGNWEMERGKVGEGKVESGRWRGGK